MPTLTRVVNGKMLHSNIIFKGFSRVIEKTNNREYDFVGETKTYKDYVEPLSEIFPEEKPSRIKRILNYGLLQMCGHICDRARIVLGGYKYSYTIYSGNNKSIHWNHILKRREDARHDPPTGYYYFGLSKEAFKNCNYEEGKLANFGDVGLWRTLFPVVSRHFSYIFAVPFFEDIGRYYRKENFITSHAVLVGEKTETGYKFTEHGWKHKNYRNAPKRISAARQTSSNKNW